MESILSKLQESFEHPEDGESNEKFVLFLPCEIVYIDISRYDLRIIQNHVSEREGVPYFDIAKASFFCFCINVQLLGCRVREGSNPGVRIFLYVRVSVKTNECCEKRYLR